MYLINKLFFSRIFDTIRTQSMELAHKKGMMDLADKIDNNVHLFYRVSESENKRINEFKKKHKHADKHSVIFTNAGVGHTIEIRCEKCGKQVDVTDYGTGELHSNGFAN